MFGVELVAGGHHGFQPFHVFFGAYHAIGGAADRVDRTVCVEGISRTFVEIQHVVFVYHMPFHDTFIATGGDFTQVGVVRPFAVSVLFPFTYQFSFIFADFVFVEREVGGHTVSEVLDVVLPA